MLLMQPNRVCMQATLDVSVVDWTFVASIFFAKATVFSLVRRHASIWMSNAVLRISFVR